MTNHIIVDGHNLIFQTGGDHSRASREGLLLKLVEYRRAKDVELTVVFDNKSQEGFEESRSLFRGINVIYSTLGTDADTIINRLVEKEENKKRAVVVTTDEAHISGYCKRMGAKVISPFEFMKLLNKGREKAGKNKDLVSSEKPETVTGFDMDYYLKKFNQQ